MPRLGDIFGTIIPSAILQAIGTPEQQRAAAEKARIAEEDKRRWEATYGLHKSEVEARLAELIRQVRERGEQKKAFGAAADILESPIPIEIQQAMKTPAAAPSTPDYGVGEEVFAMPPERIPGLLPASPERRAAAGLVRAGAAPPEFLTRLLGMQKPELIKVGPTESLYDPSKREVIYQGTGKDYEYRMKQDGSLVAIEKGTTTEIPISGPLKTGQPFTPTYVAGVASGVLAPPEGKTAEDFKKIQREMAEQAAGITGGRTGAGIQARFAMLDQLQQIRTAEELAKRDPRIIQIDLDKSDRMQSILVKHAEERAKAQTVGQIRGELIEVEPGVSLVELREIARNRGRPVPAEMSQQLHLYRNTQATIQRVRNTFTEDEIFRFAGIWNRGEQYVAQAVKQDPRFFQFLVLNEQLRSTAFQYGGKQLTPFEASVVFGFTPTGRELFAQHWVTKMNELENYTLNRMNELERVIQTPRGSVGITPPAAPVPSWPSMKETSLPPGSGRTGQGRPDPMGIR